MAKNREKPTDEQLKILDDADAKFNQVIEETRKKLSATNFPVCEGEAYCLVCECEGFMRRPGSSGLTPCARPMCGHSFTRHCVF
jgi:hypothetical protein